MKMIIPVAITESEIVSNNLTDSNSEWLNSTDFAIGARCKVTTTANGASAATNKVYQAAVASGPGNGGALDPSDQVNNSDQWVEVSMVNNWKPFDRIVSDQATRSENITIVVNPGNSTNALFIANVSAETITVTMTHSTDGEVYNETFNLIDNSGIYDYFEYFFDPIIRKTQLTILDMPLYSNIDISISIDDAGDTVEVGEIAMGQQKSLGSAVFGTGLSIFDFSIKQQDQFGQYSITERGFSNRLDYAIALDTDLVGAVYSQLSRYRATPIVWLGRDDGDDKYGTNVYGFFRDFRIVLSNPATSDCNIKVEGLT